MEIGANITFTLLALYLLGAMIKGAQKEAEDLIKSINQKPRTKA